MKLESRIKVPEQRDRQRRSGRGGLILGVIVLIGSLVVGFLVLRPSDDDGRAESKDNAAEIPEGLVVGTATADYELSTRTVAGVPRGFPQTVDGAVEAGTAAVMLQLGSFLASSSEERRALLHDVWPEMSDSAIEAFERDDLPGARAKAGLDASGEPVSGQPGDRFYAEPLPQFGAYRVDAVYPDENSVEEVYVMVWLPAIKGVGSAEHIDDLRIQWNWYQMAMVWHEGDWRVADRPPEGGLAPAPLPDDKLRPNISLEERSALLVGSGDGAEEDANQWKLYGGYSEAWPTDQLGPEPEESAS